MPNSAVGLVGTDILPVLSGQVRRLSHESVGVCHELRAIESVRTFDNLYSTLLRVVHAVCKDLRPIRDRLDSSFLRTPESILFNMLWTPVWPYGLTFGLLREIAGPFRVQFSLFPHGLPLVETHGYSECLPQGRTSEKSYGMWHQRIKDEALLHLRLAPKKPSPAPPKEPVFVTGLWNSSDRIPQIADRYRSVWRRPGREKEGLLATGTSGLRAKSGFIFS